MLLVYYAVMIWLPEKLSTSMLRRPVHYQGEYI